MQFYFLLETTAVRLLPLIQEFEIDVLKERVQSLLLYQAPCVGNLMIAQTYGLSNLESQTLSYLKRVPASLLQMQPGFDQLEPKFVIALLLEKCRTLERNVESLRELRGAVERKRVVMFPGMNLLCEECTAAREQPRECAECLRKCCDGVADALRKL